MSIQKRQTTANNQVTRKAFLPHGAFARQNPMRHGYVPLRRVNLCALLTCNRNVPDAFAIAQANRALRFHPKLPC